MSVVNKMLKDLELRDKKSVYEADYVPLGSKSNQPRKLFVGVVVLVLIVGAITWLLLKQSRVQNSEPMQNMPSNLIILPTNELSADSPERLVGEIPQSPQQKTGFSELDQATRNSADTAEDAKRVALATSVAQAKLAEVNRELAQQVQKIAQITTASEQSIQQQVKTQSVDVTSAVQPMVKGLDDLAQQPDEKPIFNVTSSNKSASTHKMFEQRIQLSLKNGDTAAAMQDLNSLIALEPTNASARKRLASLEFAQGNPKRAAFLLDQGIKFSPSDSSMRLMQARLLFREDRTAQALSLLIEHPKNVIADNELLSFRAALAEKEKDYATSLQDYAVLLKRQPGNARWMLGLAISQDKQKMHGEAVITYKKVKSLNQLSAQVVSFVDGRLAALAGS
ncbi:MAG: MSHA biogenesis protein MshN [Gammaproteobacteria bacterium]|jgi:MSHA biogenesis protein MshN